MFLEGVLFQTDKELHNLTLGTLADTRKHQIVRMHRGLLDHCPTWRRSRKWAFSSGTSGPIASRDDGAIFLTAAKTNEGSDAWYDLIPTPDSEERTDGKSVRRERFPDTAWCNTINSDRKEDNNQFCLIEVRVPLRLSVVQLALLYHRRQNNYQIQ